MCRRTASSMPVAAAAATASTRNSRFTKLVRYNFSIFLLFACLRVNYCFCFILSMCFNFRKILPFEDHRGSSIFVDCVVKQFFLLVRE